MTGISFTPKFAISPYVAPALVNCTPKSEGNGWWFNAINRIACEMWNVSIDELFGTSRHRKTVRARSFCYKMLLEKTTLTQSEIGRKYGKDHSTIYHGTGLYEDAKNGYDPAFLYEIEVAEQKLKDYFTNH